MKTRRRVRNRGLSLIEMLVTMAIFLTILLAIYQVFESSQRTFYGGQGKAAVQQNARLALDEMVKRLRVAGYFPENFPTPPIPPIANPIQIGTNSAIAAHGDLNGSGASQVFLYCLDGTTLRRRIGAQGVAASYVCAGGEVLAEDILALRFTYYNANNDPLPDPPNAPYSLDSQALGGAPTFGTTVQRAAVRTVAISLTAREVIPGQPNQQYTLTASLRLRNVQ